MDKDQKKRVSEGEIALIKQFVECREDATLILRNHFLQLEVSPEEQEFLRTRGGNFLSAFAKMMIPSLTVDVPLCEQATMYSRLSTLEQINPDVGKIHIEANDLLKEYLEQQFDALSEKSEPKIILEDLPIKTGNDHEHKRVVNMLAYNQIIPIVEGRIFGLTALIKPPEETEEERKAREEADSNR